MNIRMTLLGLCFFMISFLHASRPTIHASNIAYQSLHCNSVTLTWDNGDGSARLIVASKGAAPTYSPKDNTTYIGNPAFGRSLQYITGNYVVYNGSGNSVTIDSLKPCTTYYFTIYEHDNNSSSTLYYTSGAPTFSMTTYCVNLDFSIQAYDSCQDKNLFEFKNTSTSTVPGITYAFSFGDFDSSYLSQVKHSYKISGLIPVKLISSSNVKGCPVSKTKIVRIYQKKMAYFNFAYNHDTVQGYYRNFFDIKTGNYTNPLSTSYAYRWFTEDDTTPFSYFRKSYIKDGRHKVSLEVRGLIQSGSNIAETGCKDTISFTLLVLNDALKNMGVNSFSQQIDTNKFTFTNHDASLVYKSWKFGDGDSSSLDTVAHTYKDTGHYTVTLSARDNKGYFHQKSIKVIVFTTPKTPTVIHTHQNTGLISYPNPSAGVLTVEGLDISNTSHLELYDMMGHHVKGIEIPSGLPSIDFHLEDLPTGHYILRIQNGNDMQTLIIHLLH